MRTFLAVVIPSLVLSDRVAAQCAAGTTQEISGNWYCSEVTAITYANFPGFGSYEKITDMDVNTGDCSSVRYNYKGSTWSSSTTTSTSSSSSSTSTAPASNGGWARQAYFNAASGTAEGLTFLNHFGAMDGIPGTSAGGPASGNLDHAATK